MKDQELIKAVLDGDKERFNLFVSKYSSRIFRFLIKKVGDPSIAEDLTQETFIAAYRNLASFKNKSTFSTWLYGIALNKSRNHFNDPSERKYQNVSFDEQNNPSHIKTHDSDNVFKNISLKQDILALKKRIDRLPDSLRETLILVSFEKMSYMETSKTMKIPLGTVKSRIARARKILKESTL